MIGDLRHRVQVVELVSDLDDLGEPIDTWVLRHTVWAQIEDVSTTERLGAGSSSAQITTRVTIRHRDGIHAGMRVLAGDRTLEITGSPIDRDGRSRLTELACREVTP